MVDQERLLQRFLRYVQVDTTAIEDAGRYPSSEGQLALGRMLVEELRAMGIEDVAHDEFGLVYATLPGNRAESAVVAFNSHVDTSPETSGANVKPNVIRNFDGKDIPLPGGSGLVISAETCPELPDAKGKTIITTDGSTLLGGDDKAGVAIIMELAQCLSDRPEMERGDVRILFTCDEEIGRGVQHVDLERLGADVCYTFDGGGQDGIDQETFSADLALVRISGVNIHPAIAKDKMVNAIRAAASLIERLPAELSPERTDGRDGFLHPYVIEGGVAEVQIKILLRDFEADRFAHYRQILEDAARESEKSIPGSKVNLEFHKQYRNMRDGLERDPRAVQLAVQAHEALGRRPRLEIVRGGTDGSRLTELGLPTPNLSSGQHNIHSPLEWSCLDEMVAACEIGIEIVNQWRESRPIRSTD